MEGKGEGNSVKGTMFTRNKRKPLYQYLKSFSIIVEETGRIELRKRRFLLRLKGGRVRGERERQRERARERMFSTETERRES